MSWVRQVLPDWTTIENADAWLLLLLVDDRLPLSSYGIKSRSVLAIIGSGNGADEVGKVERELKSAKGRKKAAEEATEARTIEAIKTKVLDTKDSLGARMGQFKNSVRSRPLVGY